MGKATNGKAHPVKTKNVKPKTARVLESRVVPIDSIAPHPRNTAYHSHPDAQVAMLAQSAQTFGQYKNIVVWKKQIIAGAGIWAGLKQAGATDIEIKDVSHLSQAQAFALMTADNETQKGAVTNDAELAALVREVMESEGEALARLAAGEQSALDALLKGIEPTVGEWGDAFGKLPNGERAPFQQITFTLHDSQAEQVKAALTVSKHMGAFVDSPNENSNGNAIARICETFLTEHGNG